MTINEKILANEDKIMISVVIGIVSWAIAIVVISLIAVLPTIFTGQGGEGYWLAVAFVGIIANIIIAFNYKKADFVKKHFANDIPSPLLSIPIGIIIIFGLTIYRPLIILPFLFIVYLYYIKRK